jgi:23S rRNA pseudouridine1911/1915/1917 synthase
MPSKNMIPKGQRHHSVRAEYVATRFAEPELPVMVPVVEFDEELSDESGVRTFQADAAAAGMRLDAYLAQALPDISRARVQLLIEAGQVKVDGAIPKGKAKLKGGETIEIEGEPRPEPLHATPEDIPLEILFEDKYLAVVNKPAGMMVHAGAGANEDERNRGTLVNALLFHLGRTSSRTAGRSAGRTAGSPSADDASRLSSVGGELRPGIVHRLDKQTSGAIVVAKDDVTHRKLGEMFSGREVHKTYLALAHGHLAKDDTTVTLPIARDLVRRIRMTTRRADGRSAVSHVHVLERLTTAYGAFTLVEVKIETGRTHQIRVHLQSLGHAVVGDFLYGAPHVIRRTDGGPGTLELERNFLHAARLEFVHPRTGKEMEFEAPLAGELVKFLEQVRGA